MTNLFTRSVMDASLQFVATLESLHRTQPDMARAEALAAAFTIEGVNTTAFYRNRTGLLLVATVPIEEMNAAFEVIRDECAKVGRKVLTANKQCLILPPHDEENVGTIELKLEGY